jgi:hypothetical protein
MPLSGLPSVVNTAAVQAHNPRRLLPQAAASAPGALAADPGNLVARALTILAAETETWQARRHANLSPRSTR